MPPYDRPSRVPRPTNLILVSLQTNEPPTSYAHDEPGKDTAKNDANNGSLPPTSGDAHAKTTTGANNDKSGEHKVARPRDMTKVTSKYGKETKHFDTEEGKTEHVRRGGKTRG